MERAGLRIADKMSLGTTLLLLQLSVLAPADAKALRDAREAQQRFELTRRSNLPRGTTGSSHRCDAIVGRYCYWYDSTDAQQPPDAPRVMAARNELLAALELAARALPRNAWVAGQRVRYLMEGGRSGDAVAVARECAADRWWCAALAGLALHAGQRYDEADSAFADALAHMTDERRCAWVDLRQLTAGSLAREFGRADCAGRRTLARRLWLLSRPLWSTPGDDAATEHFARRTMELILSGSATGYGSSFGDDNRELLMRYGWVEWYTRQEPSLYQTSPPRITGHDREPSYNFVPVIPSLRGMPRLTPDSWRLRDPAAITRYAPRHVEWLGDLRHQLARFPRGDSTLLVAAYRVSDPELDRDSVMAAIAIADGERASVVASTRERWIVATVARDTMVVSLEAVGARSRRSERARQTVDPLACTRWCLSDLLLFTAADSARDVPIDVAMRAALTNRPISAVSPLGVYWEVAGVASRPLELTLTVEPIDVGRIRRAAARLNLMSLPSAVRLHWVEVPDSTRVSHGLSVRLPPSARGKLRVTLTVAPRGLSPMTASREIEVAR